MRKNNFLIISIIVLSMAILISGCAKKPDDATPIEPSEPDVPKETIADTNWPADKLEDIPQPKGNILLVYDAQSTENAPAYTLIQFEVESREDALEYYNRLKDLGYTVDIDNNNEEGINFEGTKNDKSLKFAYLEGENTASIKYETLK